MLGVLLHRCVHYKQQTIFTDRLPVSLLAVFFLKGTGGTFILNIKTIPKKDQSQPSVMYPPPPPRAQSSIRHVTVAPGHMFLHHELTIGLHPTFKCSVEHQMWTGE